LEDSRLCDLAYDKIIPLLEEVAAVRTDVPKPRSFYPRCKMRPSLRYRKLQAVNNGGKTVPAPVLRKGLIGHVPVHPGCTYIFHVLEVLPELFEIVKSGQLDPVRLDGTEPPYWVSLSCFNQKNYYNRLRNLNLSPKEKDVSVNLNIGGEIKTVRIPQCHSLIIMDKNVHTDDLRRTIQGGVLMPWNGFGDRKLGMLPERSLSELVNKRQHKTGSPGA